MVTKRTEDERVIAELVCKTIGYLTLGLGVIVFLLSVWCEFTIRMGVIGELEKFLHDSTQLEEVKKQFGHSRLTVIGIRVLLSMLLLALGTAIVRNQKWYKGVWGWGSCAVVFLTAGLPGVPIVLALLIPFLYFKNKTRHNQSAHTTA